MKKSNRLISSLCTVIAATLLATSMPVNHSTAAIPALNTKKMSMYVGDHTTLYVYNTKKKVTWSSSAPKICTVNKKGVVKAKSAGKAVIRARFGKKKLTCKMTIKKKLKTPVTSVTVYSNLPSSSASAPLIVGNTLQLTANCLPYTASDKTVYWNTSDLEIATVDNNGLVTARKPGQVTIYATSASNQTVRGSYFLTVQAPTPVPTMTVAPTAVPTTAPTSTPDSYHYNDTYRTRSPYVTGTPERVSTPTLEPTDTPSYDPYE